MRWKSAGLTGTSVSVLPEPIVVRITWEATTRLGVFSSAGSLCTGDSFECLKR